MNINEEGLRRRIGSDKLIGCYTIKDNRTYFNDIRGAEGDLVKNPQTSDYDLEIDYNGPELETGVFYSFSWHLSAQDSSKIEIEGTPCRINNAEFLKGLFNARLNNGSNLELFNNFQKTIFNEVTGAQHTYIYELLQNANDYPITKSMFL